MGFNVSAFVGFLIATLVSILDSIGDYYACASICRAPPPPSHGVNRGIAIEGLCSALSGAVGCGHATTTYGETIGAIRLTKVCPCISNFLLGFVYYIIYNTGNRSNDKH